MIERPAFRPSFHVELADPDGVILLSEQAHFVLTGKLYCSLARLIDGSRSVDDIVDELETLATPAEVYYALTRLETQGYVVEADGTIPPARAAFWDALGVHAPIAERRLHHATVSLTQFGDVPSEPFAFTLAALGIGLDPENGFSVVLTDDYLQDGLSDFNAAALASGRPWLLAKPVGTVVWIGPLFRPNSTACWECLAQRLRANREVESALLKGKKTTKPFPTSRAALSSTLQMALGMVASEAAKWIVRAEQDVREASLITLDVVTLQTQEHRLVKRPQCPCCGPLVNTARQWTVALALRSQKKQFTGDGGHRIATPEETLAKYAHHVSPITGAVPALSRVAADEAPALHVYAAGHNLSVRSDIQSPLSNGFRSRSAGKGLTDAQAKASGLCEALERYSGCFHGDEPRKTASYRQLADSAIHPNACMLFSEQQYRKQEEGHAPGSRFQAVPKPFDEEAEIEWTPVWSLTSQETRCLPTSYLYYGYPIPRNAFFCWADSNGNAAGNALEEAILQGFLELVERDSVAIWWYNRVRRPAVALDSFDDPYIQQLREQYDRLNRDVWVLDLTTDLRIPSYAAVSRRREGPGEEIILGFGAHLDPRIGVSRAMSELNQSAVFVHGVEASLKGGHVDPDVRQWLTTASIANQPHLAPDPLAPLAGFDGTKSWTDDLREDVAHCQQLVERHGMEMLVLDQTRLDIELPVTKVIVPGLRHFWARFAPGRLYDVPVKLGWLEEPLTEDQLNPIAVFF